MQDQVPECVRKVEDHFNEQCPPRQGEQRSFPPGGFVRWVQEVLHCPECSTLLYDSMGSRIFSNDAYPEDMEPFKFQVPPGMACRFTDAFACLFGALPSSHTYLKILE